VAFPVISPDISHPFDHVPAKHFFAKNVLKINQHMVSILTQSTTYGNNHPLLKWSKRFE